MDNKKLTSITGIFFALILAAVLITNIIIKDKDFSEEENRVLQKMPLFSLSSYIEGRFESKLDAYAADQFLMRNTFIKIKTSADTTLGKLESNGVYKCKDNYLMEDINAPSEKTLTATTNALRHFQRGMGETPMYFLLAPNAANVLSDKLPTFVTTKDQNKYIDDFYAVLEEMGYHTIDVRESFNAQREDTQLYYRTDHHWTTDGAYLAYRDAAKVMKLKNNVSYKSYVVKKDFRGTLASKSGFANGKNDAIKIYLPDKDDDYNNSVIYYSDTKKKTTQFYELDNLDTKDAYTVFGGSNHPLYTIKTPTTNRDKLLIVKDSYANSFIPFIAQNYREVVVVDPRYFFDNISDIIKSENISSVLFLYNANTFFQDDSLEMMLNT